jgi:hypothetical protein
MLFSSDVPEVPPMNMGELIPMVIKEEDITANAAALTIVTEQSVERAARRAERREQIAREEAAEKERKKAAIDAELQALMAKKAELDAPAEPKREPVEEMGVSAEFLADFACPPGFHVGGQFLVQDDKQPEADKDIKYELEYK